MPPYTYADAVADGVNVDFDIYRIETRITSAGSTVKSDFWIDKRDRETRARRAELLDTDFTYAAQDLNRDVVAPDQIRTVVREFRDKLFTEIFPGRTEVPKTLIFARDDSHADDIVQIVREEFGKGNDFCQKVTYRTGKIRVVPPSQVGQAVPPASEVGQALSPAQWGGPPGLPSSVGQALSPATGLQPGAAPAQWLPSGDKPDAIPALFRTAYNPRIVVTVDMIATGTDVRPLEILFFLRDVRSINYFEQVKGRGVRTISADELRGVTPDAETKDRFVIVDAVGVTNHPLIEAHPLERQPHVPLEKLLEAVALGAPQTRISSPPSPPVLPVSTAA